MASVQVELRAWLLADAAVAAITTRIHPAPLPQSCVLPAITYTQISSGPFYSHQGDNRWRRPRYQIDCWAADYDDADALARAVIDALSGRYWGNLSFVESDRDMPESMTGFHRRSIDVFIWHRQE
jgi:hypothetical protein